MESKEFGIFSLEEEEGNELFITQTPSECKNGDMLGQLCDRCDFEEDFFGVEQLKELEAGCVGKAQYSDISDPEDDFANPIYRRTNG